jgi:hypothetical protein
MRWRWLGTSKRRYCYPATVKKEFSAFFLEHTTSSAYGVLCVLYDGVILQQSQLGSQDIG